MDPSCLAFSSNGFAGRLKGASFLAANASTLTDTGQATASLCVYIKHTGRDVHGRLLHVNVTAA